MQFSYVPRRKTKMNYGKQSLVSVYHLSRLCSIAPFMISSLTSISLLYEFPQFYLYTFHGPEISLLELQILVGLDLTIIKDRNTGTLPSGLQHRNLELQPVTWWRSTAEGQIRFCVSNSSLYHLLPAYGLVINGDPKSVVEITPYHLPLLLGFT